MEVQSYLFELSKGWTLDKAKAWFEQHHKSEALREHFFALLPFKSLEKIIDKPLRIHGIAMTAGMSRNFPYVPEELQSMPTSSIQRHIKRQVEREIFDTVLVQAGLNPAETQVRLNWGSEKAPEVAMADILKAAELGFIRQEEFQKNVVKFSWELWEKTQLETSLESVQDE